MYRGHSLQLAMECVGYSVYFTTYEVSMGMRVRVCSACLCAPFSQEVLEGRTT
jgi:hypothetical protein